MANYLRIGDTVPNFTAETQTGAFDFYEYNKDSWVVFCSHPADYTPVCTTELGTLAKLSADFANRNCKLLAISTDTAESHKGWIKDINETQNADVQYPIVADPERKVANQMGMIHPNADDTMAGKLTIRTVFFIDPNHKLRAMITYPASTGRNFPELVRVLDSLQLTDNHKCATPANWNKGDDVMVLPNITDEDATARFPKGYKKVKPYMRITPDPSA